MSETKTILQPYASVQNAFAKRLTETDTPMEMADIVEVYRREHAASIVDAVVELNNAINDAFQTRRVGLSITASLDQWQPTFVFIYDLVSNGYPIVVSLNANADIEINVALTGPRQESMAYAPQSVHHLDFAMDASKKHARLCSLYRHLMQHDDVPRGIQLLEK